MFTNIIIYFKSKFFRFIILCNEWVQIFFLDYFFEISFNIYCSLHYRLSAHFGPTSINLLKFRTCFLNFNSNTFKLNLLNFTNFLQKLNLSSFFFLKILFLLNIYESFFMSNFFFKTNTFLLKKFFFGLPILILLILKKKFFFVFSSNTKVCCVWPQFISNYEYFLNLNFPSKNLFFFKKFNFFFKNTYIFFKKKNKNFFKKISIFFKNYLSNFIKFCFKVNNVIMFIRKQKCFNKGRYSRNRQLYRTGVYWCLYINIIALIGLNYIFYKFTINFMLYWWFFFLTLNFFIFPQFFKNKLYIYKNVKNILLLYTYFFNFFTKFFFI